MTCAGLYRFRQYHVISTSLKTRLSLAFGGLTIALTALIVAYTSHVATEEVRERVGSNLQEVALQLRDKLELQLRERYFDMATAARMTTVLVETEQFQELTPILDQIKSNFDQYAWIGFVSPSGHVWAATGDMLVGKNVSERPWFQEALKGPFLGDVHKALLLQKLLEPDSEEPLRFIDVALPMKSRRGELLGVLGAHLDLRWVADLGQSLLEPLQSRLQSDLVITSDTGSMIIGPAELQGSAMLERIATEAAASEDFGYTTKTADDGRQYLLGYTQLRDDRFYQSLDWVLMVRKPLDEAFAEAVALRNRILLAGAGVALVFCVLAWLTARRVSRPLLDLANEAEALNEGRLHTPITQRNDFEEVRVLTHGLRRLVVGLINKEKELTALNANLEQRVQGRTAELEAVNRQLRQEMDVRERLYQERRELVDKLEKTANTDALTGVSNRRHFFAAGEQALRRARRHERPLSAMMFDVDHFKSINDSYGHGVGDEALCHLVTLAGKALRDIDLLARIGGEEFVVVLEDADERQAAVAAERLRALVQAEALHSGNLTVSMTISIGVAAMSGDSDGTLEALLARADRALYQAKAEGRNRVVRESEMSRSQGPVQAQDEKKPLG
ncbi:MAG: diguanylate cyclase [Marinobacter sp.]|uniref:sensor domain-containing diguanylate cyclase n=1 Tax=Marinobacter sp. TaxID=50741 RepID=UPI00299EEA24|nr:diguanylate cyclase [Marinobacter sp.]MDX1633358.1 diguanylate cyclase [Marinobacter sp.]